MFGVILDLYFFSFLHHMSKPNLQLWTMYCRKIYIIRHVWWYLFAQCKMLIATQLQYFWIEQYEVQWLVTVQYRLTRKAIRLCNICIKSVLWSFIWKKKFQNAVSKHLSNPSTLGGVIREVLGFKAILEPYYLPENNFTYNFTC